MKSLQNLVLFKLGWVACILFAAAGQPLLSILSVALVAGIHLARVAVPAKEALFLLIAGLLGLVWESIVVNTGLLEYIGTGGTDWVAPAWIVAMWVLFGTTINHGLSWLKRHWVLSFSFGLFGGPMAFYAGSKMGAVQFTDTILALGVLGAGWAILLPLACLISDTITDSEWFEPKAKTRAIRAQQEPLHITHARVLHHG
jgi:hypothetical protein